ncbi:MAG: VWA domain-containing protein [Gammaproteobacteria bacterium]|nr:VWA domain-containing protein [Gammaproteobacteria bacterium]
MLVDFFYKLREYQIPASLRELLDLLCAMEKGVVHADIQEFYQLARLCLVKDESYFDRFDRAFADYFEGISSVDLFSEDIPDEWLRKQLERFLSEEEKSKVEALGGLDKLMDTLKKRMEEQQKRHQGGSKWIGTGGTSPFGAYGYNPEGIRIGQDGNRSFRAVKVWDKREFRNLDSNIQLGVRNTKMALRKLRKFARTGADEHLDIDDTIHSTARNGGLLDIKMTAERHNAVKVLIFFDVGGSMDAHVRVCEELFSAVHTEFKHLEYFYFHNCIYESVWQDNFRRRTNTIDVHEIIRSFGPDYKVIFVGDATMGPYEITYSGGSVEHWNAEAGAVWMERITSHFDKVIWLNPQPEQHWEYHHSVQIMKQLIDKQMFPLTLAGLTAGITQLS